MRIVLTIGASSVLFALAMQSGCANTSVRATTGGLPDTHGFDRDRVIAPPARPGRLIQSRVGAEIMPGRVVPYDNMSLPLVSPDGRFVATQTRVGPDWPTILAEHDAHVPLATRLEIYRLPEGSAIQGGTPNFITDLDEPVLLGRSYDERGFLVEAPREDGSRWIGHVSWETGAIDWLVADESVNAFAAIGPDGRLAWSRRAVDAEDDHHFELVIRHGSHEWAVESPHESWLMPTWSWRGDGLFALSLSQGHLEAVHAIAADPSAFRQSRQRISLATDATIMEAYQTIGAQVCAPAAGGGNAPADQFIFFHPALMRMAMWSPRAGGVAVFDRLSYAAVVHDENHAIVGTEDWLLWRHVHRERERSELLSGMHVPRPTPHNPEWPYVLLSPDDGQVAVIPMRPLMPNELARR